MVAAIKRSQGCQLGWVCWLATGYLLFGSGVQGIVRRVPEDYATIRSAVDRSFQGDTVLLSPGVYRGSGNRDIEFHGKDIVIKSVAGPDQTIIDCEQAGRGFYIHESETRAARIEGITIRNGRVDSMGYYNGGGISCRLSSPTIVDCRLVDNWALLDGGGLDLSFFDGVVDRCVVSGNYAGRGGGVSCMVAWGEITNCVITGNGAGDGGGVCFNGDLPPTGLVGCTIAGNHATRGGGIASVGVPLLERCILLGNGASHGNEMWTYGADLRCCDIDTTGIDAMQDVTYDENCMLADPLFCDPASDDWSLDTASPCLPQHSPCGELIGALGPGCGTAPAGACCLVDGTCLLVTEQECANWNGIYQGDETSCHPNPCSSTPAEPTTWGWIKSRFLGIVR